MKKVISTLFFIFIGIFLINPTTVFGSMIFTGDGILTATNFGFPGYSFHAYITFQDDFLIHADMEPILGSYNYDNDDSYPGRWDNTVNFIDNIFYVEMIDRGLDVFIIYYDYDLQQYKFHAEWGAQSGEDWFADGIITTTSLQEGPFFELPPQNQVPLPGCFWLLSSGLLGLAGWRRFRKG
jgi:hypothetical protein